MSRKSKKKKNKRRSSFNIGKSKNEQYITYARMWAETGVIYIEGNDGIVSTMTVLEAAHRASRLNAMLCSPKVPNSEREKYARFVEKAIEVIKEAKSQLHDPSNASAKVVANVTAGKTAEGKQIKMTPQRRLEILEFKFPMLTSEEIRTVCNEHTLSGKEKTEMLRTVNQDRLMDKYRQAETASGVLANLG